MITSEEFIKKLVDRFPQITTEVTDEDYEGLITLQIGCFTRFTQHSINNNNWFVVANCFDFIDEYITKVEKKVENALYISYIGKLNLSKNKAKKLLSPTLLNAYYVLVSHASTSPRNLNLNNFLTDIL